MKDVISKFSEHALLNEMNERATKGLWEWESRVVEEYFPRKGSVLDIGCGCGREAIALAKMGYEVFAVDVAAKQIAIAKDNARAEKVQITFAESDGVSFPVGDALFDVIVLWTQLLGNMASRTEQLRLLESCRHSLAPDGLVSASVHERDFCRRDTPQCTDENWLYAWGRGQLRYQLFTRDSLDSLFKEAGLQTVVTEVPASLRAIIYTVARRADDSQPLRPADAEKPRVTELSEENDGSLAFTSATGRDQDVTDGAGGSSGIVFGGPGDTLVARHRTGRSRLGYCSVEESGVILSAPRLLGHKGVRTTIIYTHVLTRGGKGVRSPGDSL